MKYTVTLYQEVYTTVEIDAESKEDADTKVIMGDYDKDNDVLDVTVKESEII
jgi:hypothetical protein